MNHKATASCPNGHNSELGQCDNEVKKFFGGTKVCGSKGYTELSKDEIQCVGCKIIYNTKKCSVCGVEIPVSGFQKKGVFAKLG
jgi:hypothetical protein